MQKKKSVSVAVTVDSGNVLIIDTVAMSFQSAASTDFISSCWELCQEKCYTVQIKLIIINSSHSLHDLISCYAY